jgi:hypothetical protein
MKIWVALYGFIWVLLLEFLLGLWPNAPFVVSILHAVLGLIIVVIAYYNRVALYATRAPGRVKRIAGATFGLTILMAVLGVLLWFHVGASWSVLGFSVYQAILVFHVVNALAIITQVAAVAIAYDMWEDREFEKETKPGEVPPPPTPTVPSGVSE